MNRYAEWISDKKIEYFVEALFFGSDNTITFSIFLENQEILFTIYFHNQFDYKLISSNLENYRDFINRVELSFKHKKYIE